jgi:recombination protein RecT
VSQPAGELQLHTGQTPATRALKRFLQVQSDAIARRLAPFGISAERYSALVLTEVVQNDQLLRCMETEKGQASLQVAVFHLAQHGLEPGPLGHAYILPFYRSAERFMKATPVFGWKGYVQLALRSPKARQVDVAAVYPEDDFDFRLGTRPSITHVPRYEGPPDPERLTHVYAVCHTANGGHPFVVLTRAQVEHYRSLSKQPNGEAWREHWVPMAKKTAVRRGFDVWPMRVQEIEAVVQDWHSQAELGEDDATTDLGEGPAPPPRVSGGGRDRRRPVPAVVPPPPDPPAPPGPTATAPPPPPDPAAAAPTDVPRRAGGSMTERQFLGFVCEQIDVDPARLLQAVLGDRLSHPATLPQVRQAIAAAREIAAGAARLVEEDGRWQVLPVADDGGAA